MTLVEITDCPDQTWMLDLACQGHVSACDQLAEFSSRQNEKAAGFKRKLSAKQELCLDVGSDRLSRSIDPWSELEPMIASVGDSLF